MTNNFIKGWNTALRLIKPSGFYLLDEKRRIIRKYGAMPHDIPLPIPQGLPDFNFGYRLAEKEYS